jgi:hypothetical protein
MSRSGRKPKCPECGAAMRGAFCTECGARRHRKDPPGGNPFARRPVVTAVAVVVLGVGAFLAGRTQATAKAAADTPPAGLGTLGSLDPAEQARQLYDRVVSYAERGKVDSARLIAPMAVLAYESLGPLDHHARYDIGMVRLATGDSVAARAQADTILSRRPTHLLGLALAMRAAPSPARRTSLAKRLLAAESQETAAALPEYADHQHDVSTAMAAARTP